MEYAIYPMKTISISQRANGGYSHVGLQAWDIVGTDTGIEPWYAPCRVKVLAINPRSWMSNTVFFGSCDENGNEAKVMCEDGVARVLTFSCTHMEDEGLSKYGIEVNKKFEAGEACYEEGKKGKADGYHVHMEVAEGWAYDKTKNSSTGQWETNGIITIADIFYQLSGFNTIGGSYGANGYTFKTVTSRTVSGSGTVEPTPTPTPTPDTSEKISITGYGLYVNKLGLKIRTEPNSSSESLITVPVGKELKIRKFLDGFQSDGYQWAATEYEGNVGYSQIDTNGYYTVVLTDTSVISPSNGACIVPRTLYLIASSKGANIRASIPSGTATFVSAGSKIKVEELIPGFQSDGYQWVKASYDGTTGYVQADVKNWHYFKID